MTLLESYTFHPTVGEGQPYAVSIDLLPCLPWGLCLLAAYLP